MRRGMWVLLVVCVAVGLLAGPASAKTSKLPKVVRAYMAALALSTPVGSATTVKLAAPGSLAAVYSRSLGGVIQAAVDAGQPLPASTVKYDDKKQSSTVCSGTPSVCIVFSAFKVTSGKITDFERDGKALAGVVSAGDGSTHDALGSSLTVVGGYEPNAADLIVSVAVKNGPTQLNFNYIGTYIGPDGHQVQSSASVAPNADLRPGSSATIAFVFPGAVPGGSVIVKCANHTPLQLVDTEMPVPVFRPS